MIFQILLKTAVISSCSFKYDRHCIAPALLFHFLDNRFKIRKPLNGIVQYLRLAEWCRTSYYIPPDTVNLVKIHEIATATI